MKIQKRGMCTQNIKWWSGIYARDVAGDSGESIFQSRGDDTVGICAVTVAHILPIISAMYLLNCTLVGIKSVIFIDYWDGDRLPTIASDEKA